MPITIIATLDQRRHLELDLPADAPIGEVEITIRPLDPAVNDDAGNRRAIVQQRLQTAGLLSTARSAPPDAVALSDQQREALGRLFAAPQSLATLIDQDRGPR